ncbi:intraflagellar transport protein 22 homolog isoform X2 [Protopterus annectens]|uniref:intraflagellar transport protein 22 homolog isoform X2 n=1 Tax=Protopterus annectens TaxID=7888 RepID=UPI001CFBA46D|nr:intraflagellar transport protein 22 homolog isoform X2 [Protopterus annectens]
MFKAKILVVGPSECGKTVLSNFLSDATETIGGEYSPTQGVRFETCWPALMKESNGIIIVFNPDLPRHLKEIEVWYTSFVLQQRLQDSQCLLIAHHKPGSGTDKEQLHLAQALSTLKLIHSNLDDDPEDVRTEFRKYLAKVVSSMFERQDQEEMSIITQNFRNL